jgi:hypothetical protein
MGSPWTRSSYADCAPLTATFAMLPPVVDPMVSRQDRASSGRLTPDMPLE